MDWLVKNSARLARVFPQLHPTKNKLAAEASEAKRNNLSVEAFTDLLKVCLLGVLGASEGLSEALWDRGLQSPSVSRVLPCAAP